MAEPPTRKLAVILHADVADSTVLVRREETVAHGRITAAFARLSSVIEERGGTVHETRGDALLAEFSRASDAVSAAIAFQALNRARNAELADDIVPEVRIGISLGEVVIADDTVTGPGVVLAQRVEQLAEPGGVCVTAAIHEAVPGRLPFRYTDLGARSAKGFDDPVHVYGVALEGGRELPAPERSPPAGARRGRTWTVVAAAVVLAAAVGLAAWWQLWRPDFEPASVERMAFPLPDKPSIAVLPFDNMSGDPSQDYFSDGLTENLITTISQIPDVFVIARNSVFTYKGRSVKVQRVAEELGVRYVLEGSFHRSEDEIRVHAQLVDAVSGRHLWARRFDRSWSGVFALQDELTQRIVSSLSIKLSDERRARLSRRYTTSPEAYDHFLRGQALLSRQTAESNAEAREAYRRAIDLDPEFARAYGALAITHAYDYRFGWNDATETTMDTAVALSDRCLAIDVTLPQSHRASGNVHLFAGRLNAAIEAGERAIDLDPGYADAYVLVALAKLRAGRAPEAVESMRTATRLNPHPPSVYEMTLGSALYHVGRLDEARVHLERAVELNPNNLVAHVNLAATLGMLGDEAEAQWQKTQILVLEPGFDAQSYLERLGDLDPAVKERSREGMRRAGLLASRPPSPVDRPSIAVLPFVNMSGDANQEYFADGMAEDIITDLSRLAGVFVIARNSSFAYRGREVDVRVIGEELGVRYLLEGSVRRAGDSVRINVQLIEAETGGHVWAERYDGSLADVFSLQDQVTDAVVSALAVSMTAQEQEQLAGLPTSNLEAYDFFLQAGQTAHSIEPLSMSRSLALYEKAIELDPEFAQAHAERGRVLVDIWRFNETYILPSPVARRRAFEAASRALELRADLPRPHSVLGLLQVTESRHDAALASAHRAVELAPGDAVARMDLAQVLAYDGALVQAVQEAETALKLDPRPGPGLLLTFGLILFLDRQYERAVEPLERARAAVSQSVVAAEYLAMVYAELGRIDDARARMKDFRSAYPAEGLASRKNLFRYHRRGEDLAHRVEALRKAGLPQWPWGFEGDEANRLDAGEIENVVFGRTWQGELGTEEQFVQEIGADGSFAIFTGASLNTGTMKVEGAELCIAEVAAHGEDYCGPIYRNPEGSLEARDEYTYVIEVRLFRFSVVQ